MFHRIIIQNLPDGKLSGIAVYDTPTSDARPLSAEDFAALAPEINGLFQEQLDAAVAAVAAERDSAVAKCNAIVAKLTAPDTTKEDAIAELEKSDKARKLEALTKEKAKYDAEAARVAAEIAALDAKAEGAK